MAVGCSLHSSSSQSCKQDFHILLLSSQPLSFTFLNISLKRRFYNQGNGRVALPRALHSSRGQWSNS